MESAAQTSQRRALQALHPWDTIPEFGEFEPGDQAGAEEMKGIIRTATAQVKDAIGKFEASVNARMAEQPDPTEREAVAFALSKSHISTAELRALYETYGGNYQLASAISDRAAQMGVELHAPQTIDPGKAEETAMYIIAHRYDYPYGSHTLRNPITDPSNVSARTLNDLQHLDALGYSLSTSPQHPRRNKRLVITEDGRMKRV